jgi:hypothetical protein
MAKQTKRKRKRNVRAGRFAVVFFFLLSLSPLSPCVVLMFFFTTPGLNNEIACVSFSFKPPLGFACFDEITGLFFGKGSTATSNGNGNGHGNGHGNGWIIIFSDRNKYWQAGVECVRLANVYSFLT